MITHPYRLVMSLGIGILFSPLFGKLSIFIILMSENCNVLVFNSTNLLIKSELFSFIFFDF